jgi:hypothetical protein
MFMNSESYSDVLQQQLMPTVQTKCHGLLSSGMTACHTAKRI